jgi:hypothetical protein
MVEKWTDKANRDETRLLSRGVAQTRAHVINVQANLRR